MIQTLLFYLFATILVIASLAVISVKNPVHSILSLIVCFIASSGLFILIGAEYLALTLVIIYVGAIAILFLFVVMMLDINFTILRKAWSSYMPFFLIIAGILIFDLYVMFDKSLRIIGTNNKIQFAENHTNLTNTESLGLVLYTDYILPFQLSGIILLIAMIGAVVLTLRTRINVKKQKIQKQLLRTKKDGVEIVKVNIGEGV